MLTVLATATSDLLASVADTKEAMDLTDAVNDEKLKRFIRRASAQIEQFCNRPLLAQTYRAMLPSYGGFRYCQLQSYQAGFGGGVYGGLEGVGVGVGVGSSQAITGIVAARRARIITRTYPREKGLPGVFIDIHQYLGWE